MYLAAGVCVAVSAACVLATIRPRRPDPRVLMLAAAVTAATVPLAGGVQSPTDTEAALAPSALVLGGLLAGVALSCALSAAPRVTTGRVLVTAALALTIAGGLLLVRTLQPDSAGRVLTQVGLAAVLLTGIAVVAGDWPGRARDWSRYLLVALGTFAVYPSFVFTVLLATAPLARMVTALAGSPAVNGADTDIVVSLAGLLVGLAFGALGAFLVAFGASWVPTAVVARAPAVSTGSGPEMETVQSI